MGASATIEEETDRIVEEFSLFDDWTGRYEYLVDLGRRLAPLEDAYRDESHRVQGCQSRVWFHAWREGGRVHFVADSDALIVKGLIALLLRVYSGRAPAEILATPPDFLARIELGSHLTGSRANGLHAMIRRIKAYAEAFAGHADEAVIDPATLH